MEDIRLDVVGVVQNAKPGLQILIVREPEGVGCFLVYQWYGDDGPYDDWVANEHNLHEYLKEAGWEIEWHPELRMPTHWKSGPGSWQRPEK